MKSSIALLGVAFVLASGGASAQVANGSFESPVVPSGGFANFVVGSSGIPGWTVVGPAGAVVSIVSTTFGQNGVSFQAQSGAQWLDLTGDGSNSSEGVSQAATTIAGHQYEVTFFVGNTTGGSIFGTTSTVNLAVNGVQAFSAVNSMTDATGLSWQQFAYDFVATGTSTTLALSNGDPGGDNSNGLDNVAFIDQGPVTAPVPEPETYTMMIAGFAALGFAVRKRKARRNERLS
ncbi:MAG: DUF642 domain-containing protein [Caldimonas sp.]